MCGRPLESLTHDVRHPHPGRDVLTVTLGSIASQPRSACGLQVSQDGGASWQPAPSYGAATAAGPADGFRFVGMTGTRQGVAVPENPAEHAVWFTFSGGQSWQRFPITGA
jgi:hypothetical protein